MKIGKKLKVKRWISYDYATTNYVVSVELFGGFFEKGYRWNDYIDKIGEKEKLYLEILRQEIIKKRLKENGSFHQYHDEGTPQFSDKTIAIFSMRGWGDFMAAIWSTEENKNYNYMDFY